MKVTYSTGPDALTFVARRPMSLRRFASFYTHVYQSMGLPPDTHFDSLKPAQKTLARKLNLANARGYILHEALTSPQGQWVLENAPLNCHVDLSTWDKEYLVTLRFDYANDAMLFKLTWLGVEA